MKKTLILAAWLAATASLAWADGPTAFQLAKTGDQYLGVQSKDKVVAIHSDRSVNSLTPDVWYVDYFDPDAMLKAVEVKFGGGQKMDVSRPVRALEWLTDAKEPLDPTKLNIDSDRAIQIATTQPILKNLTLRSTQLWLQHGDLGPQWRVQLWAAKVSDPNHSADIGNVILSAGDGSIIKLDLHVDSVN
jgi:hypothetical protein